MRAIALLVFLALPHPLAAAQYALQCRIEAEGRHGWVPDFLFIGVDPEQDRVVISDPIVLQFNNDRPVEGSIAVDNPVRITFRWSLAVRDGAGNRTPAMIYRATLFKDDLSMRISAQPAGYQEIFTGKGLCADVVFDE